jgi:hypothetical protein
MIPAGADWLATIKKELELADGYLILLTPASIDRPWIWFETGAAWMSQRPLATASAGDVDRAAIPMPLASFQILSLEDPREATFIFQQLGGELEDPPAFCARVHELANAHAPQSEIGQWSGVEVASRYFAWDGSNLHQLDDRPAIPAPPELLKAISENGLVPTFGLKAKLMNHLATGRHQVFETDRKTWRRELLMPGGGDQILLVHEE